MFWHTIPFAFCDNTDSQASISGLLLGNGNFTSTDVMHLITKQESLHVKYTMTNKKSHMMTRF